VDPSLLVDPASDSYRLERPIFSLKTLPIGAVASTPTMTLPEKMWVWAGQNFTLINLITLITLVTLITRITLIIPNKAKSSTWP
jgi:hypothetical protein